MPHFKFSHFALPLAAPVPGFEAALVARLNANDQLTSLIGDRLYPLNHPEDLDRSAARLVYAITSNTRPRNLSGASGIATAEVHIDCRSPDYGDCKAVQELLRQYDGFRGLLAGSVTVLFTQFLDHSDGFEWPSDGSDEGMQHLSVTFYFKYRESLPVAP